MLDDGSWVSSAWADMRAGWNSVEVRWMAYQPGTSVFRLNGNKIHESEELENDAYSIKTITLGASGAASTTSDTILFDDLEVHRYTRVGTIDEPAGAAPSSGGTVHKVYSYAGVQPHAVTDVTWDRPDMRRISQ